MILLPARQKIFVISGAIILFIFSSFFLSTPAQAGTKCCCTPNFSICEPLNIFCGVGFEYHETPQDGQPCSVLVGTQGTGSWVNQILGRPLIPEGCSRSEGKQGSASDCGINDMITVIINVSLLILGVLGSFALLMFFYGGIMFLVSAGNQERVQKAKNILTNAAIGVIIVLTSYVIINFVVIALTKGRAGLGETGKIFDKQEINKTPGP